MTWRGEVPKKSVALRLSLLISHFVALSLLRHSINGFEQPQFSAADNPAAFHPDAAIRVNTPNL